MSYPRPFQATKNLLIIPGFALAWILADQELRESEKAFPFLNCILAFLACCLIAAWNYALNDYCDRGADRWHPEKCNRLVDTEDSVNRLKLFLSGAILLPAAFALVRLSNLDMKVAIVMGLFLASGLIYNIHPLRVKRFPFVDVMAEAANFPIRLAIGWYALTPHGPLPPLSALMASWAFGGVLLTGKRAAELARIGNMETAKSYRPALLYYTQARAIVVSSLYGMIMLFGSGVLFAVYQSLHNLIFLLPFVLWLMGIYLWKLADDNIAARELEPEKLLRMPGVWISGLLLGTMAIVLIAAPIDLTEWLGFFGMP